MEKETFLTLNPELEGVSSLSLVPVAAVPASKEEETEEKGVVKKSTDDADWTTSVSSALATAQLSAPPTGGSLPLLYSWTVWEQVQCNTSRVSDYKQTTRDIATFSTVEEFWRLFQSLPQPSELMTSKRMMREEGGMQAVDAIMIFREGIEPMWEAPQNATGGHFDYKLDKSSVSPAQADEYWNNLMLGMVGGTLEPPDMVTGIRLVDKLERSMIRLELWFTDFHKTDKKHALKLSAASLMSSKLDGNIGQSLPECIEKPHMKQRGGGR